MDKIDFDQRIDKAKAKLGRFYSNLVKFHYPETDMTRMYNAVAKRSRHVDILDKMEAIAKLMNK